MATLNDRSCKYDYTAIKHKGLNGRTSFGKCIHGRVTQGCEQTQIGWI
jgi:hypothetical protein